MKTIKHLCLFVIFGLLTSTLGITAIRKAAPLEDLDPLMDVSVTVTIQKIRALDKKDVQVHREEFIERGKNPNLFVKITINGELFTSPVYTDQRYIYAPNFSATVNVPDDQEFVTVTIQLWDHSALSDVLCDIGNQADDATMTYSIATGQWTGDDHLGDPSGYGRLNGCDDGNIYGGRRDAELWFTITQNDYDNDGAPYWIEVNQYSTDPTVNNTLDDTDHDNVPFTWEWRWGYNPMSAEAHSSLDPDNDGLSNRKEYLTSQWGSDPFAKDLFVELDQMATGPNGEESIMPAESKEMLYTAYDRYNVRYHLDDGSWTGTGSDMIPFDASTSHNEVDAIYQHYFLHDGQTSWRRGIFHYGLLIYNYSLIGGCMLGSDSYQISSILMEKKAKIPYLDKATVYASAYMHEMGHTLDFNPIPGHDSHSGAPWQLGWWYNRPYKSCMNYGYMYYTVDYSDGSRPFNDYNDWQRMDLTAFLWH